MEENEAPALLMSGPDGFGVEKQNLFFFGFTLLSTRKCQRKHLQSCYVRIVLERSFADHRHLSSRQATTHALAISSKAKVRSLPRISENVPWDPAEHENEERARHLRLTTSSMVTLKPHSGISLQSFTAVEVEETIDVGLKKGSGFTYLVKAVKNKLVTRRVVNKEQSMKAAYTKSRDSSSSSTINEAEQEQPDETPVEIKIELADIHELVKDCKIYIVENLKITSEKMREAEAETTVVLEAVEKHRLQGKSLSVKPLFDNFTDRGGSAVGNVKADELGICYPKDSNGLGCFERSGDGSSGYD